jgi:hypothetical protein
MVTMDVIPDTRRVLILALTLIGTIIHSRKHVM